MMKILAGVEFIEQINDGCCPASVNIVLDYYQKGIRINQHDYLNKMSEYSLKNNCSLFKSSEYIFNFDHQYNQLFQFTSENTSSKIEWEEKVKGYIDVNIPVIISTIKADLIGYHITVIFGYDNDNLCEMCPTNGQSIINIENKLINYQHGGTDLLIIKPR